MGVEETPYAHLIETTLEIIQQGELTFKDEQLKSKFQDAFEAVFTRTD